MPIVKEYIAVFFCWFWCSFAPSASAVNVQVTARMSDEATQLGEPVRLEIIIHGASSAEVPGEIKVNGLKLENIGKSIKVQMLNMQMTSSCTYTFAVYPLQPGHFVIPSLRVNVNGKSFHTNPLSLRVANISIRNKLGRQPSPHQQSLPNFFDTKLAFGMLTTSKKKAYVGEVIPIKLRYYFHPRLHLQSIHHPPSLMGDGFTVQKVGNPKQNYQELGGIRYMVLTFYSSICPLQLGKLYIPSTSLTCQISQLFPAMSQDIVNTLFQRFFSMMPTNIADAQQMTVRTDALAISVVPLPDGRPLSFHGAIGDFSMRADISPKQPSPGEPITLRATISGKGNFEQIRAVDLEARRGWKIYSSLSKFKRADDDFGEKVFEWILIPNEKKHSTPEVVFSYFSPIVTQYITLRSSSQAVQAEPAPPSSAPIAITPSLLTTSTEKKKFGIVRHFAAESFQPVIAHPWFSITNGIAVLTLLAFFGFQHTQHYAKRAASRRSLKACLARACSIHSSPEDFYSSAVEFLQLWAQLISGRNMQVESAEEIAHTIGLSGRELELVAEIFSCHEELSYGLRKEISLSDKRRDTVLALLRRWR